MAELIPIELVSYICGDCDGEEWLLKVIQYPDGKVGLLTICANPSCVERKRQLENLSPDSIVVWDEFDITDSHYAEGDQPNPKPEDSMLPIKIDQTKVN